MELDREYDAEPRFGNGCEFVVASIRWRRAKRETVPQLNTQVQQWKLKMIQRLLFSGCALIIGGLCQMPVQAQQAPANKPAPATQPAAQSVTSAETRQFANAVKQVLAISRQSDTQAAQAIQAEGLTEQRFDEIFRSQNNPQQKPTKPIEASERQKYDRVIAKLTQIGRDNDAKVEAAVKKEGLEPLRFNQIFQIVRSNPQLRQQVQEMIRQ